MLESLSNVVFLLEKIVQVTHCYLRSANYNSQRRNQIIIQLRTTEIYKHDM